MKNKHKQISLIALLMCVLVVSSGCCDRSIIGNNCYYSDAFNELTLALYLPSSIVVGLGAILIPSKNDPYPSDERDIVITVAFIISEFIWAVIFWGLGLGNYLVRLLFY